MSEKVAYFGFGSLVNKHTLRTSYVDIVPARLKGWRRHWQSRDANSKDMALLSIHRDENAVIDGMVVIDLLENLPLVDQREAGYERQALSPEELDVPAAINLPEHVYVYVAKKPEIEYEASPLLQSYLDAVLQGFRDVHGDEGVQRFFETTSGFSRPMIADRVEPRYPRNVTLNDEESSLFDEAVKLAGVKLS